MSVPLTPGPASAHDYLVSATPAAGSLPEQPPTEIELVFNEVVRKTGTGTIVTGPDGKRWEDGAADIVGSTVTQPLRGLGPAGAYRVDYRVVSADGHSITGQLKYRLAGAGAGTATGAPSAVPAGAPATAAAGAPRGAPSAVEPTGGDDDGGLPLWLPVGVGVVVVGLASAALATRRREVGSDDD